MKQNLETNCEVVYEPVITEECYEEECLLEECHEEECLIEEVDLNEVPGVEELTFCPGLPYDSKEGCINYER